MNTRTSTHYISVEPALPRSTAVPQPQTAEGGPPQVLAWTDHRPYQVAAPGSESIINGSYKGQKCNNRHKVKAIKA